MNHYRSKHLVIAVVPEFDGALVGFFTGAVEKAVLFQAETVVRLRRPVTKVARFLSRRISPYLSDGLSSLTLNFAPGLQFPFRPSHPPTTGRLWRAISLTLRQPAICSHQHVPKRASHGVFAILAGPS